MNISDQNSAMCQVTNLYTCQTDIYMLVHIFIIIDVYNF